MDSDSEDEPNEADAQPTPQEFRLKIESVMDRGTVAYWRGIEDALRQAGRSNGSQVQINALNALVRQALWGDGLWALAALPAVVVAISMLFAWWACAGLAKLTKVLAQTACALAGLALSTMGLSLVLYAPQARRLDFAMSMLPNYLGEGVEPKPKSIQLIRNQSDALKEAAAFQAPIWAFPLEIHNARQTIEQLVIDP
jgi:hypothetical protein